MGSTSFEFSEIFSRAVSTGMVERTKGTLGWFTRANVVDRSIRQGHGPAAAPCPNQEMHHSFRTERRESRRYRDRSSRSSLCVFRGPTQRVGATVEGEWQAWSSDAGQVVLVS